MSLIVQKFGGTSVGTSKRIRLVAERIARSYSQGHSMVVVVSAMGKSTDHLIELAHEISDHPHHREMDMLLSTGERISMALLSMALWDLKIPAVSLTGSQSGIITDGSHQRARIQKILGHRIRAALDDGKVVIVAGFQGVSETKEITTLGRGGSDTTAVALAAALNGSVCEIFTDVDGVYSADPRVVKEPRLLKTISHDLMVEMATRGAGVLHPRSVELAKQFSVPLWVRNSQTEGEGTAVVSREELGSKEVGPKEIGMEEYQVTCVTSDLGKYQITATLSRPSTAKALWHAAAQAHLIVLAPTFTEHQIQFFTDRDSNKEWDHLLQNLKQAGDLSTYDLALDTIPVSVIGDRFSQDGSALQDVLEILNREKIRVRSGSGSALAITVGIPENRANEAVAALHRELVERKYK